MDAFLSRQKSGNVSNQYGSSSVSSFLKTIPLSKEASTDMKLATLASLFPTVDNTILLELLTSVDGSVEAVRECLSNGLENKPPRKRSFARIGHQTSLSAFRKYNDRDPQSPSAKRGTLTRKGQTLHLYTPEDVAAYTPCSIIHNFLPSPQADDLLRELLEEAPTFERQTFKLFENVVQSPHSACFFVDSLEERERQKHEYVYNGSFLTVRHGAEVGITDRQSNNQS